MDFSLNAARYVKMVYYIHMARKFHTGSHCHLLARFQAKGCMISVVAFDLGGVQYLFDSLLSSGFQVQIGALVRVGFLARSGAHVGVC